MPIPDYQTIMLPLLEALEDGNTYTTRDLTEKLAVLFKLTEQEKRELLPSGQQPVFANRVGWARTYLKKAGLLESERRATQRITIAGLEVLKKKPPQINIAFLEQFPAFVAFRTHHVNTTDTPAPLAPTIEGRTPEELLDNTYTSIQNEIAEDLVVKVKSCSPDFFEKLVVELLLKMGYGGSIKDAGKAIGQTGDGGIDGIIKEDKLGLDAIYIQAKRWEGTVGRPEIHKFVGALEGQRAKKGVFITTSYFSKDALEYVANINTKIVLIDGEELAQLMIENNVGVSTLRTYDIKKIDSDYFVEDQLLISFERHQREMPGRADHER